MTTPELVAAIRDLQERIGLHGAPMAFFYSHRQPQGYHPPAGKQICVVGVLARVARGETVYCDQEAFGCRGCGYYLGFTPPPPGIDDFVSVGVPGQVQGERYKKSPDLVRAYREAMPVAPAPQPFAVFKPVAALTAEESPQVIFTFATPDELSGLVSLANFGRADDAVICTFGSGCGTLISRALMEAKREQPRAILGMFDPSARPCVAADQLSFSAPTALWAEMAQNAPESFLTTETWAKVKRRLGRG